MCNILYDNFVIIGTWAKINLRRMRIAIFGEMGSRFPHIPCDLFAKDWSVLITNRVTFLPSRFDDFDMVKTKE